jgi:hypothetical protein
MNQGSYNFHSFAKEVFEEKLRFIQLENWKRKIISLEAN